MADIILALVSLGLAALLTISSLTKFIDIVGFAAQLPKFGVPAPLATNAARLIAGVELGAAALMMLRPTLVAGLILACALFTGFGLAIVVALRRGTGPNCGCFGSFDKGPVTARTAGRAVTLALVSGCAAVAAISESKAIGVWSIGPLFGSPLAWLSFAAALYASALVFVWISLLRQHGRILQRIESLEASGRRSFSGPATPGIPARKVPEFTITLPSGATRSSNVLDSGKSILLVFSAANCPSCAELEPLLSRWIDEHQGGFVVVVANWDGPTYGGWRLPSLPGSDGAILYSHFRIQLLPSAVVLAPGDQCSEIAVGVDAIRRLVEEAATKPDTIGSVNASDRRPTPVCATSEKLSPYSPSLEAALEHESRRTV
jgi:thiol-disulfide isomerase/thioredoxin